MSLRVISLKKLWIPSLDSKRRRSWRIPSWFVPSHTGQPFRKVPWFILVLSPCTRFFDFAMKAGKHSGRDINNVAFTLEHPWLTVTHLSLQTTFRHIKLSTRSQLNLVLQLYVSWKYFALHQSWVNSGWMFCPPRVWKAGKFKNRSTMVSSYCEFVFRFDSTPR